MNSDPRDAPGIAPLFSGDKPDRRHWTLAISAGMASYLDSAIIVGLGVGLAVLQEHFGMSTWGVGALSAALTLSIAAGAFVGGRVADLVGRMRAFTFYILLYAAGMAVMAAAVDQTMLFVGIVIAGLAAGADLPTSVAVVSERSPQGAQGRLVSTTQVMWFLGIAATQLLAFAFSGLGITGIRIIFAQLVVVALVTWAVRRFHPALRSLEADVVTRRGGDETARPALPLRTIMTSRAMLVPILLTGVYYIFWGMVANTFGQFGTYFLITVGGAGQTLATGLNVALIPVGLLFTLLFVRIVDTKWRNPVFVVGGLVQAGAMAVAGVGNGVLLVYVLALVIYNIGVNVSGEANYKVWTQESLPIEARATAQGFTYAIGRFVFALFALVTPSMLAASPNLLLWLLVAFALVATALGWATSRHLATQGIVPGAGSVPAKSPA
ncbi:MFS transporter [Pseudonocardia sichuanensis]